MLRETRRRQLESVGGSCIATRGMVSDSRQPKVWPGGRRAPAPSQGTLVGQAARPRCPRRGRSRSLACAPWSWAWSGDRGLLRGEGGAAVGELTVAPFCSLSRQQQVRVGRPRQCALPRFALARMRGHARAEGGLESQKSIAHVQATKAQLLSLSPHTHMDTWPNPRSPRRSTTWAAHAGERPSHGRARCPEGGRGAAHAARNPSRRLRG